MGTPLRALMAGAVRLGALSAMGLLTCGLFLSTAAVTTKTLPKANGQRPARIRAVTDPRNADHQSSL
jgi:hypothetical protein